MSGNVNLEQFDPRLKEFYEFRAEELTEDDKAALLRLRKAIQIGAPSDGERVLDFGAKQGRLGTVMRSQGIDAHYTGFDISDSNVEAARSAGFDFVQGSVSQPLPFPDKSFDCVFALELVEHLTAPVAFLSEIRRILSDDPQARAIISTPSPYNWVEIARELLGRQDPEGHLVVFTTPVMANIAALAGFSLDGRWGTSVRLGKTLLSNNSLLARSRIYRLRKTDQVVFGGRRFHWSDPA
jgi:2-polyprenyl-3-methyl-5-hydroxy-6-metoxy-1,4-benzoquinol methylase